MATNAEKLTELQTALTAIKATMTSLRSGASSFGVDGLQRTEWRLSDLRDEQTRIEKSIQRLLRGGRGMPMDMSAAVSGNYKDETVDPYGIGND